MPKAFQRLANDLAVECNTGEFQSINKLNQLENAQSKDGFG